MKSFHRIAEKQIKEFFGNEGNLSRTLSRLMSSVSATYVKLERRSASFESTSLQQAKELRVLLQKRVEHSQKEKARSKRLESLNHLVSSVHKNLEKLQAKKGDVDSRITALGRQVKEWKNLFIKIDRARSDLLSLIENSADPIWSIDANYKMVVGNQPCYSFFSVCFDVDLESGFHMVEGLPGPSQRFWQTLYNRGLAGESFVCEYTHIKEGGGVCDYELSVNPLQIKSVCSGVCIFCKDVTKRKANHEALRRAKEKAEAASKTKSEFLATMSHELRTPLNAILGYSEMLLEELDLSEQDGNLRGDVDKIHRAGTHLLHVINDILDLSKMEAGKMELHLEQFILSDLLDEVSMSVERAALDGGNQLFVNCDSDIEEMSSDSTKLRQTLFNLLSNACKFTKKGKISLSASSKLIQGTPWVFIEVSDTGIGMSAEQQKKVFQAFHQAEASTTRQFGGTGLGLAICQKYSQVLGGSLTVTSQQGKGSIFTLALPTNLSLILRDQDISKVSKVVGSSGNWMQRAELSQLTQKYRLEADVQKTLNVLLFSKDKKLLEDLEQFASLKGYRLHCMRKVKGGREFIATIRPLAVLLDRKMVIEEKDWNELMEAKTPFISLEKREAQRVLDIQSVCDYKVYIGDWSQLDRILDKECKRLIEKKVLCFGFSEANRRELSNEISRFSCELLWINNIDLAFEVLVFESPGLVIISWDDDVESSRELMYHARMRYKEVYIQSSRVIGVADQKSVFTSGAKILPDNPKALAELMGFWPAKIKEGVFSS
ncbi:MAG: hypothetical protein CMO81_04830 [Waddliaceae bacterium]|nr:hypothetical protein [Waddliaceae bacterium]